MREITTTLYCDQHHSLGQKVPAVITRTIGIDTDNPKELDLCAECNDTIVAVVEKLVSAYGRATEASLTGTRPFRGASHPQHDPTPCPVSAGCNNGRPYWNKKSVTEHVWKQHVGRDRPPQPKQCPDCAFPGAGGAASAIAMSKHRANSHAYDPLAEAVAQLTPPTEPTTPRRRRAVK